MAVTPQSYLYLCYTLGVRLTKKRKVVEAIPEEDYRTCRSQWDLSHVKLLDKLEQLCVVTLTQPAHLKIHPSSVKSA